MLRGIELSLNNSARIGLELSEWQSMGDWRLLFLNRDRIRAVTPDDVKRVAATYLKPSNLTLGIFVPTPKPERSEIPPTPDVAALVKDYKGDTARSVGEAFDPSPNVIEQRTIRERAAERAQGGAAAQEDPRRHRRRHDEPALRHRAVADEPRGGGRPGRGHAPQGNQDADPPADSR